MRSELADRGAAVVAADEVRVLVDLKLSRLGHERRSVERLPILAHATCIGVQAVGLSTLSGP